MKLSISTEYCDFLQYGLTYVYIKYFFTFFQYLTMLAVPNNAFNSSVYFMRALIVDFICSIC